jgi:hypothetical protein
MQTKVSKRLIWGVQQQQHPQQEFAFLSSLFLELGLQQKELFGFFKESVLGFYSSSTQSNVNFSSYGGPLSFFCAVSVPLCCQGRFCMMDSGSMRRCTLLFQEIGSQGSRFKSFMTMVPGGMKSLWTNPCCSFISSGHLLPVTAPSILLVCSVLSYMVYIFIIYISSQWSSLQYLKLGFFSYLFNRIHQIFPYSMFF